MFADKTVAIIGQGYVGLPLSIAATKAGWNVIGIDNSSAKVEQISNGISPVIDVSNADINWAIDKDLYQITSDFSEISKAKIVVYCVPTPLSTNNKPDLSFITAAIQSSAPFLSSNTLLINESTSFPGTLRNVIMPLVFSLTKSKNFYFAVAPERINPGDTKWKIDNTPRVVSGISDEDSKIACEFYRSFSKSVIHVSQPEIAEASKLLENSFRMINISFINQLAQICSSYKIDINEVINAASTKPYGFMEFRPSLGVGGHCIPIDPQYLQYWAEEAGETLDLIADSFSINQLMPKYIASKARNIANHKSSKVLILGVAYKSGSSDTRETPVKSLRHELEEFGFDCFWYDELVEEWESGKVSTIDTDYSVAIVTISQPNLHTLVEHLVESNTPIIDCSNILNGIKGIVSI
jgi:UDP-N-acetyl-D-glucosamine dehydrogenase